MTTNIELRVNSIYDSLSNAEKKAATYFLNNVESVFDKPIAELAEESGASKVAWVRFCKAIGFDGLKDLKKSLVGELFRTTDTEDTEYLIYSDIREAADIEQVILNVKNRTIRDAQDTAKLLDPQAMEKAAKLITEARTVRLFGLGASALVAEDLFGKLLRIDKNVCFSKDLHVQLSYASNMAPADAAVLFSTSGKTSEILEILSLAQKCGTPTIAFTTFGKNPLAINSDIPLYISSSENTPRSGAMSSRIAQLMSVDILFTAVAKLNYDRVVPKLENSLRSIQSHKR